MMFIDLKDTLHFRVT